MTLPQVDTEYQFEHVMSGDVLPDLDYLWTRMSEATVETVASDPPGRVLDVGSGASKELFQLVRLGWETYAVDASAHMLGVSRLIGEQEGEDVQSVRMVRAIGERLPFADASLDVVACQAALDHFSDRFAFMEEAARLVKPTGRVIITLNNFEGLACKLGRLMHRPARASRLHHCSDWPCWDIPPDHTFKGDWQVVRELGHPSLVLDHAYGISLLCMLYGWGHLLSRLPDGLAQRLLRFTDRVAYGHPSWSDVIVSVWRPASEAS